MIYILKVITGLLILLIGLKGIINLLPKIKIDIEFIGMAICFTGLIILYCIYS